MKNIQRADWVNIIISLEELYMKRNFPFRIFFSFHLPRNHIIKEAPDDEKQTEDDNANDDADDRLSKLMNSKLSVGDKNSDDDDDVAVDGDDDGARLSKLMNSKLGVRDKASDNDDDEEDLSKLVNAKLSKDSDDGDDDNERARLTKLLSSKLKARDNDNDDNSNDDDGVRLSKLLNSKLSAGDENSDDDETADASDKNASEDGEKRSKLPSRFKPSTSKGVERSVKKNRFGHQIKYSKRVKSKHKRWSKNKN